MLNGLADASQRVGMGMNLDKTKIMVNEHITPVPITVADTPLEVVQEYVYLGQILQLGKNNFEKELSRRIQLGWAAFGKLRQVFSSPIPQCLKTKVFNQCVVPVMTASSSSSSTYCSPLLDVGLSHGAPLSPVFGSHGRTGP